jgi:hypothetical protein
MFGLSPFATAPFSTQNVVVFVIVSVTGVQAIGLVTTPLVWSVINDNQTPNWVTIDDSQSITWSAINDANTVVWVQIPT